MARPLRIEYPGAYYHVMNRGNRREDIFLTDKDRQVFLDALADSCDTYRVILIIYVLMENHFHLLFQTPQANLSEFTQQRQSVLKSIPGALFRDIVILEKETKIWIIAGF